MLVLQARAQYSFYGLIHNVSEDREYFFSVDPVTGAHSTPDTIPALKWTNLSESGCVNTDSGRYVFSGKDSTSGVFRFYVMDLASGAVLSKHPYSNGPVNELVYNPSLKRYFGLHLESSTSLEYYVSVNPYTGHYTNMDFISGVGFIASEGCIVADSGKYIFLAKASSSSPAYYYTIDAATGHTLHVSPAVTEICPFLNYSPADGKYYSLVGDHLTTQVYLARIDPYAGTVVHVATIPGMSSIADRGDMDGSTGHYVVVGEDGATSTIRYYSIDVATGTVTSSTPCSSEPHHLRYYNPTSTGIRENKQSDAALSYPNPFSTTTTVQLKISCEAITITGISGNLVRSYGRTSAGSFEIQKNDLKPGLYLITLFYTDKTKQVGRLVVEE